VSIGEAEAGRLAHSAQHYPTTVQGFPLASSVVGFLHSIFDYFSGDGS